MEAMKPRHCCKQECPSGGDDWFVSGCYMVRFLARTDFRIIPNISLAKYVAFQLQGRFAVSFHSQRSLRGEAQCLSVSKHLLWSIKDNINVSKQPRNTLKALRFITTDVILSINHSGKRTPKVHPVFAAECSHCAPAVVLVKLPTYTFSFFEILFP